MKYYYLYYYHHYHHHHYNITPYVHQDTAFEWYLHAAEAGDAWGQNNVGVCYMYGDGVERSPTAAREWFELAADQGGCVYEAIRLSPLIDPIRNQWNTLTRGAF